MHVVHVGALARGTETEIVELHADQGPPGQFDFLEEIQGATVIDRQQVEAGTAVAVSPHRLPDVDPAVIGGQRQGALLADRDLAFPPPAVAVENNRTVPVTNGKESMRA